MKVKHGKDSATGIWYREIFFKNYKRLEQLMHAYEEKGYKVWLNLWDIRTNEYLLTVELGANYVR